MEDLARHAPAHPYRLAAGVAAVTLVGGLAGLWARRNMSAPGAAKGKGKAGPARNGKLAAKAGKVTKAVPKAAKRKIRH